MLLTNTFHTATKTRLYWVGGAANHQSNTDMENYENRPLNKPIIAIMSQQTWKCTIKSDIAWHENWTQNEVVENTKGIILKT